MSLCSQQGLFNDVRAKSTGCWKKAEVEISPEDKRAEEPGPFLASNFLCHYDSSLVVYKGSYMFSFGCQVGR